MQTSFERTISALYETVLDASHWPVAMRAFAALFDAPRAALIEYDFIAQAVTKLSVHGHEAVVERDYGGYYHLLDPGRPLGMAAALGEWLSDEQMLDVRSKLHGEYIHDFALRYEIGHVAGCKITGDSQGCEYLSLCRPLEAERFGEPARNLYMELHPHLVRISRMRGRLLELSRGHSLAQAALDQFQVAVVLVDRSLRVQLANACATRWLTSSNGLGIVSQRLSCREPSVHERLCRLAAAACTTPARGGALRVNRSGRSPVILMIVPIPARHELAASMQEPVALVVACDPDTEVVPLDVYRSLFSLTPTEAALLSALAQGVSLGDWAKCRGVSVGTVRSQLHALFEKTGTGSQARLVSLVKSIPALASAGEHAEGTQRESRLPDRRP